MFNVKLFLIVLYFFDNTVFLFFDNTVFNTSFKIFISLLTWEDFFLWAAASLLTHLCITNGVSVSRFLQVDKIINFALPRWKGPGFVGIEKEMSRFRCQLRCEVPVPGHGHAGLGPWRCCYPGPLSVALDSLSGFKAQLQLCDLAANLLFLALSPGGFFFFFFK